MVRPNDPVVVREPFGQRLKRIRQERGLSQRDVEGEKVTYAYVSRLENCERHPSQKTIRHLAQKLGVSEEYLEYGSDTLVELLDGVEELFNTFDYTGYIPASTVRELKQKADQVRERYGYPNEG